MAADMRVWMLTGDKRETAINIGANLPLMIFEKFNFERRLAVLLSYLDI